MKCPRSAKEFWTDHADLIDNGFPGELEKYLELEEERVIGYCKDKKPGIVLEAGCGRGRIIERVLPCCGMVIGVDYSPEMVRVCSERFSGNPDVRIYEEDISGMHFRDDYFDLVTLTFNTLGNTDMAKEGVLLEMKRVLKPDGGLLISVYSEKAGEIQRETYQMLGLDILKESDKTIYTREGLVTQRFSKEELYAWLQVCGLNGEIEPLTDMAYFAVAEKG
jgi:ubiquinone/menaquinone biosynthesis C-methylase UbiE